MIGATTPSETEQRSTLPGGTSIALVSSFLSNEGSYMVFGPFVNVRHHKPVSDEPASTRYSARLRTPGAPVHKSERQGMKKGTSADKQRRYSG
jgi:hypothetical protein